MEIHHTDNGYPLSNKKKLTEPHPDVHEHNTKLETKVSLDKRLY